MNKSYRHLLYGMSLLAITASVNAQVIALKSPQQPIIIDGDAKEWGDNLIYNSEKNIYYSLSNDKQNLYLLIKCTDDIRQSAILSSGVTLSIDTKGRKKKTFIITFPMSGLETGADRKSSLEEKRLRADLTKLKKIGVKGFKDIDEEQINTENAFNIQTALNFDDKGDLIYEEAIPLQLFHADDIKNEWAFNIKINAAMGAAPERQLSVGYSTVLVAGPPGGGPPSSAAVESAIRGSVSHQRVTPAVVPKSTMGTGEVEVSKATDFWGTFTLANMQ